MFLMYVDLWDRECYVSICEMIFSLLDNNILFIVNENDIVIIDKLKVGDNDNLLVMVVLVVEVDVFIICLDIDGLYDKNLYEYDDV